MQEKEINNTSHAETGGYRKLKTLEMHRISVDEFKAAAKMPLVVVLDDVRSMYNVGSVFRTCDAFRCQAVYLCGITAQPPSNEIHKTALGAEESVDWLYFKNCCDAVNQLHQQGYKVLAVEQCEGSTKLGAGAGAGAGVFSTDAGVFSSNTKYAVIVGNEVHGVHQEVIDMCDGCLEIPQLGTKHSLNVSVTAGMIIWEFVRGRLSSHTD